jgi:hypothetical protein
MQVVMSSSRWSALTPQPPSPIAMGEGGFGGVRRECATLLSSDLDQINALV